MNNKNNCKLSPKMEIDFIPKHYQLSYDFSKSATKPGFCRGNQKINLVVVFQSSLLEKRYTQDSILLAMSVFQWRRKPLELELHSLMRTLKGRGKLVFTMKNCIYTKYKSKVIPN